MEHFLYLYIEGSCPSTATPFELLDYDVQRGGGYLGVDFTLAKLGLATRLEIWEDSSQAYVPVELGAGGQLPAVPAASKANTPETARRVKGSAPATAQASGAQPGPATAASRPSPAINLFQELRRELQNFVTDRVRQLMQEVQQELQIGDSVTEMGQRVMDEARIRRLVTVTDRARNEAQAWLQRAQHVGQQMQEACKLTSQLGATLQLGEEEGAGEPEERQQERPRQGEQELLGVQGLFSEFIKTQPPGSFHVHDVHTTTSVCGEMKPDIVLSCSAQCMPLNTVLILDLKRQDESPGDYCHPSHFHQLACYGAKLLEQLPAVCRSHVLLAVTDLRRIMFMRVIRNAAGDGYEYELSEEMEEVLPALCAVLLSEPSEHGASYPPELTHNGEAVQLVSYLGGGATSTVYGCTIPGQAGQVVAKVVRPAYAENASKEKERLESLAGCPGVPVLLGHGLLLDDTSFLLLQPLGKTLAADSSLLQRKREVLGLGQLVETLHAAHTRHIVHRDIRADNIMVEEERAAWYIIDWGCAVHIPMAPVPASSFCGTIRYASDRILQLMALGGLVDARPEDDLQSLVKTLFILSHPLEHLELRAVGQREYARLLGLWGAFMQSRSFWARLMVAAARGDYDEVGAGLVRRFE